MDIAVTVVLGTLALYLFGGLKVLREYERAVYFFLGRSWGAKGPGLIYVPPLFAKTQTVSLRVVALDIPPQDVITRDNIAIKVNAVLYMLVRDPVKAVIGVENYLYATSQLAQTTLRSVLGETELDELLMSREKINNILKNIIDKRTENWGIEVTAVEVKDVDLPPEMKRAMARQAEAERERRAKIINAEGELQASEKLAQAARIIGSEPAALISREALERIIQRAAELQAAERDIGDGLTKDELLALGQDVGIPARYLQQALLEERTRSVVEQGRGALAWLAGPSRLSAARVAPGDRTATVRHGSRGRDGRDHGSPASPRAERAGPGGARAGARSARAGRDPTRACPAGPEGQRVRPYRRRDPHADKPRDTAPGVARPTRIEGLRTID